MTAFATPHHRITPFLWFADQAEEAAAFAAAYRRRMAEEERTLFPLARRDIGPAACGVMAREMAARRR